FELWKAASETGADLLWRVRKNIVLPFLGAFEGGSYLSEIVAAGDRDRRCPARVRVIEYTLGRAGDDTVYRLITTICDPDRAPADDLAGLYHQRWQIENTLDEIRTHQGGRQLVLRSRYPDGVEQEIYGFLLVHHALRDVMHHTAHQADLDPDRLSFTRTLRIARRHVTDQVALSPFTTQPSPDKHRPRAAGTTPPAPQGALQPPRHQAQDQQLAPQTHLPPQPTPTTHQGNHTCPTHQSNQQTSDTRPVDWFAQAQTAEYLRDWDVAIALVSAHAECYSNDPDIHDNHLWHLALLARAERISELTQRALTDIHARRRLNRSLRKQGMEAALRSLAEDGVRGALYILVRLLCETSRMQEAQRVVQDTGPDDQYAHQIVAGGCWS
ncbi:transposase, partial [Streptomyces sp. NPDC058357]|uniref:transposase n=1 Tax=Streptomyces sp. NPDC058357 TaxID=3346456 RepID=UPI00364D575F